MNPPLSMLNHAVATTSSSGSRHRPTSPNAYGASPSTSSSYPNQPPLQLPPSLSPRALPESAHAYPSYPSHSPYEQPGQLSSNNHASPLNEPGPPPPGQSGTSRHSVSPYQTYLPPPPLPPPPNPYRSASSPRGRGDRERDRSYYPPPLHSEESPPAWAGYGDKYGQARGESSSMMPRRSGSGAGGYPDARGYGDARRDRWTVQADIDQLERYLSEMLSLLQSFTPSSTSSPSFSSSSTPSALSSKARTLQPRLSRLSADIHAHLAAIAPEISLDPTFHSHPSASRISSSSRSSSNKVKGEYPKPSSSGYMDEPPVMMSKERHREKGVGRKGDQQELSAAEKEMEVIRRRRDVLIQRSKEMASAVHLEKPSSGSASGSGSLSKHHPGRSYSGSAFKDYGHGGDEVAALQPRGLGYDYPKELGPTSYDEHHRRYNQPDYHPDILRQHDYQPHAQHSPHAPPYHSLPSPSYQGGGHPLHPEHHSHPSGQPESYFPDRPDGQGEGPVEYFDRYPASGATRHDDLLDLNHTYEARYPAHPPSAMQDEFPPAPLPSRYEGAYHHPDSVDRSEPPGSRWSTGHIPDLANIQPYPGSDTLPSIPSTGQGLGVNGTVNPDIDMRFPSDRNGTGGENSLGINNTLPPMPFDATRSGDPPLASSVLVNGVGNGNGNDNGGEGHQGVQPGQAGYVDSSGSEHAGGWTYTPGGTALPMIRCHGCGVQVDGEWMDGPDGPRSLCVPCGVSRLASA